MWSYTTASAWNSTILGRYGQTAYDDLLAVAWWNNGDQNTAGKWLVFQVKRSGDVRIKWRVCDINGANCKSVANLWGIWNKNGTNVYYNNWNVWIWTSSPRAKLEIRSSYNEPALMAWYSINNWVTPWKSSIAMWHNTKAGWNYSIAMWYYATANWYSSTAMWYYTQANSYHSTAIWGWTKADWDYSIVMWRYSIASWDFSTAMWVWTKANGSYSTAIWSSTQSNWLASTAMWVWTKANGSYSTAMWHKTQANWDWSTSMGKETIASWDYSMAIWWGSQANWYTSVAMWVWTKANWYTSVAMWASTQANWNRSTAMWYQTQANWLMSTAMWWGTKANWLTSVAMWQSTDANWKYSTAMWAYTKASSDYSTIVGINGQTASDDVFAVAYWNNGDKNTAGSWLIFQVKRSGDVRIKWRVCDINGANCKSVAQMWSIWNKNTSWYAYYYNRVWIWTSTPRARLEIRSSYNEPAFMAGYNINSGITPWQHSIAMWSYTKASWDYSTAMWHWSQSNWNRSIAFWSYTQANGYESTSMWYQTRANGYRTIAMWDYTIASTVYSTILGRYGQTASDDVFSVAWWNYGDQNIVGSWLVFQVKRNGNVYVKWTVRATAFVNTSDRRLKKDIKTLKNSLKNIDKLRWVSFKWKKDNKKEIWLIAQEVEKVYPDLVVTWKDGYKAVKYSNVVAILIEWVKTLYHDVISNTTEIEKLKVENKELKAKVDSLEARLNALEQKINNLNK